jgi:5-methylthioadenosine/S-adenosylhomocysteine deaminase
MPPARRLLIQDALVYDPAGGGHEGFAADIAIENDRISAVYPRTSGTRHREGSSGDTFDARGKLVTPGFVNAHYHSHDILLKGCFDPEPLEAWVLNALPRTYPPRSLEEIRLRTLLGAVECIRSGITTVQDMVTLFPLDPARVEAVVGAYEQAGLRAVIGLQVANVSPLDTVPYWRDTIPADAQAGLLGPPPDLVGVPEPLSLIESEYRSRRDRHPRLTWALAPSSPERCSRDLLERFGDLARRLALPVVSHIYITKAEAVGARLRFAEFGGSLISLLRTTGLLGPRTALAHGVWLSPAEIEEVAAAGASVVLNHMSNLKTKNGVAPIRRFLAAGLNLALGCDNCSCSDCQNMFQAMKMFVLLAAVSHHEAGPPGAVDALCAATINGARVLGLGGEVGRIAPGMKADLVLFDLADPAFVPLNSPARQLVYAECGRGVDSVIIDGHIVLESRKMKTLDEAALRAEISEIMTAFRPDAARVIARNRALARHFAEADKRAWAHDLGFNRYVAA